MTGQVDLSFEIPIKRLIAGRKRSGKLFLVKRNRLVDRVYTVARRWEMISGIPAQMK